MSFFEIENVAVEIIGYKISYVELIGTLFGLFSVYYATRANILTWATGIVNEVFLFILFFQVQLYADMFLQVYFFFVTIYGWYNWRTNKEALMIFEMEFKNKLQLVAVVLFFSLISGFLISNIHLYLPQYFRVPAAYPFIDSIIMVSSIAATILLAKKKIENWYLWIVVDLICVGLYFRKGVYFLSLEYLIFLGLATFGLFNWKRELKHG